MECLMDHIALNVEDDERMITFYSKVLLFAPERLEEYRKGDVPFPSVRLNADTIIDLFPKKLWQKSPGAGQGRGRLNHFCIALKKEVWKTFWSDFRPTMSRSKKVRCHAGAHTVPESRYIFGTRRVTLSRRGITKDTTV